MSASRAEPRPSAGGVPRIAVPLLAGLLAAGCAAFAHAQAFGPPIRLTPDVLVSGTQGAGASEGLVALLLRDLVAKHPPVQG